MELSRRAVIGGVAMSCAGGVAPGAVAAGDGGPPIVDNGADDDGRNVRIELTVVDGTGTPLADEPVVLRDSGGSLDVRKGRTGPKGGLVFVESVGPSSCNPLTVRLPGRDEQVDLGCHNGYTELTETIRVGTPPKTGPVRVVDSVPQGADRVWPVSTDVQRGHCTNAHGKRKPTTGEGAADWFVWSQCGSWKEYAVDPGKPVYLEASTGSQSLTDARFEVLERRDGSWQPVYEHDDRLGRDGERVLEYTPESGRIRVRNRGGGFYMKVYSASGEPAGPVGPEPTERQPTEREPTGRKPTVAPSDTDGFGLPGIGAAVWGLVVLLGGLLAGAQVAYGRSTPAREASTGDDDWKEMRTHPDVTETTWSDSDLPEYAVTVDGRRVIARRNSGGGEPRVSLKAPLRAAKPGAGFELVADGDRVAMGSSGPLAPELPEAVWQRLDGLRAFGTLTVDTGTATVAHDFTGEDANALQSPDDLVAQATAVVNVVTAVEDSVLDDPGGDTE